MPPANIYRYLYTGIILLLLLHSCKPVDHRVAANTSVDSLVRVNIAAGNRLADINSDSLKIITQALYDLHKVSGNDSALVYADFFESTYYWHNGGYQKAMQLAIKALAVAQRARLIKTLPRIYLLITTIENEITDYRLAFATLKVGLDFAVRQKDTSSIIALHGLEGMLTRSEGVVKKDEKMFDKSLNINYNALKMAESDDKYEWLKIRLFNTIGQCYADKREFKMAAAFFEKAIPLAIKYEQPLSLIRSNCRLGEVLYYLGDKKRGLSYIQKANKMAREHGASFWLIETTAAFYRCYMASNDYKLAMRYNTENRNIRDSLKALTEVRRIGELRLKYEEAKKDKEINLLNAQNRLETLLLYASAIVVLLLVIIVVLIYLKQKKEKRLMLAEKTLLDDELHTAEIELNIFTENLKDKNSLIEEFKNRIEHLQLQNVNRTDIEHMEQLLTAHIMTEENWERFKKLFDKVYPTFFYNLKNKIPAAGNLTATDTRMLVLIKLQLSNLEMANLTGITIEGIKKSKQRLRKKLGLEAGESLGNFAGSI